MKLKEERTIPNRQREEKNNLCFQTCRLPCCPQGYFSVSELFIPEVPCVYPWGNGSCWEAFVSHRNPSHRCGRGVVTGKKLVPYKGRGERVTVWDHADIQAREPPPWQHKVQTGVSYVLFAFSCSVREIWERGLCVSARTLALRAQGILNLLPTDVECDWYMAFWEAHEGPPGPGCVNTLERWVFFLNK